ncbi:alpha-like surface protein, partial [Streptococcus pluranimalium]|uniref:alpha-like surface protein n=1 Tax=Streptococcus pluranimalium TaxID=82348 RepID=UPI0039FBB483
MFRRSKNNSYETSQTKQRFSIKKFKFGAASVLIGISFLGGFTQGQFNISTNTVFAAEEIPGSAATLNTSMTKNLQNGRAYIDLYDVKNGKIDPLQLITLNSPDLKTQYVIRQGRNYFPHPSELTTVGAASINYTVLETNGSPRMKPDGQADIVNVSLTIYDSSALREKINEVEEKAADPKWSDGSRDEVLTGLGNIKKDIDNNPKTQDDINNKIIEVNELEKKLVTPPPTPDKDKYDPTGGETPVPQGTPVSDEEITYLVTIPEGSNGVPKVVGDRPNTDVPGDYKVTVEVTYPDGTKDTVEVTVHVTPKPVPDKDKYD